MTKELSYIEKLIPFICNMRVGQSGEQPTPASLTPFSVGQTIKGFDFGNVNNGDTNSALDAFLLELPISGEPNIFIAGDSDTGLFAIHTNDTDEHKEVGCLFTTQGNNTMLYATDSFTVSESGIQAIKGHQNLSDGKFVFPNDCTSTLFAVNTELTDWNGILIGAVEAEPGPTPPEPGDLTPFESGGSLHAGDKLVVNLNASNSDIVNYLSTLEYDPQAYSCLLLDTTNEPGHSGQPFRLAALNFGTTYGIMGTDATGYPSSFWGYDTSTGEGGWQLTNFDGDDYYTIKIEGGVEYYSNIVLNDTASGWNGVFIGVEKGE